MLCVDGCYFVVIINQNHDEKKTTFGSDIEFTRSVVFFVCTNDNNNNDDDDDDDEHSNGLSFFFVFDLIL